VNGIVRNMPTVFMLDYFLKTSCTTFLLFVDASTLSKLSLMLISDILGQGGGLGRSDRSWNVRIFLVSMTLCFHPMSPDSINCSDADLHLDRYDSGANVITFSSNYVFDFGRSQL